MRLITRDLVYDVTYNEIMVSACAQLGIAAFTGDGVDPQVMIGACQAIKKVNGKGFQLLSLGIRK